MRDRLALAAIMLAVFFTARSAGEIQSPQAKVWSFDSDAAGRPPPGFSFGLWTKADSVTEFDDLSVRSLVP